MASILFIQTSFIGDVILMTSALEQWHNHHPLDTIEVLVRKGNESLFDGHPFVEKVWVWQKQKRKYQDLWRIIKGVRARKFDHIVNFHRHAATGLITVSSGAEITSGFTTNPLSTFFTHSFPHSVDKGLHEIERNQQVIAAWTQETAVLPKLYPPRTKRIVEGDYCCIAPGSVWATKRWSVEQWTKLVDQLPTNVTIVAIGSNSEFDICESIMKATHKSHQFINTCGKFSLLESAALLQGAVMNYVHDSAPMHLASAVNAPVTAIFCSTVPSFGFGPLSETRFVWEAVEDLPCRPCGLHGKKKCPEGHFACGNHDVATWMRHHQVKPG